MAWHDTVPTVAPQARRGSGHSGSRLNTRSGTALMTSMTNCQYQGV